MWPGRVRRVGSGVVWDPGGPEAFQEGRQFEQLWPWGLTRDDPSWATICLSSHERASLARGPRVWSGLAWGWGLDGGLGEDGEWIDRRAGGRARRHRTKAAVSAESRATFWANCGLSHKLLEPGWKAVSEGSYQLCCRWRVRGEACRLLAGR